MAIKSVACVACVVAIERLSSVVKQDPIPSLSSFIHCFVTPLEKVFTVGIGQTTDHREIALWYCPSFDQTCLVSPPNFT